MLKAELTINGECHTVIVSVCARTVCDEVQELIAEYKLTEYVEGYKWVDDIPSNIMLSTSFNVNELKEYI